MAKTWSCCPGRLRIIGAKTRVQDAAEVAFPCRGSLRIGADPKDLHRRTGRGTQQLVVIPIRGGHDSQSKGRGAEQNAPACAYGVRFGFKMRNVWSMESPGPGRECG
jgi:hypothetical protein